MSIQASTESHFAALRQRLDKMDADSKEAVSDIGVATRPGGISFQSLQAQLGQVAATKDLQVDTQLQ